MLGQNCTVDRTRILHRLESISQIGTLRNGGVRRLAFSPEETEAKSKVIGWARALGCIAYMDEIGNVFMRLGEGQSDEAPVLVGSHLDTQPVGGNFDGVLGVIAALECAEIIKQIPGQFAPVEIVIWCNEEGARFSPTTMGSAVHAGHFSLVEALNVTDARGLSVKKLLHQAVESLNRSGINFQHRDLAARYKAYVELHIEQGPILESEGIPIGLVTDVQGLLQYAVQVSGVAGHAGAIPMNERQDALTRARAMMTELDTALSAFKDLRYTIGRIIVAPGSINTIPAKVDFTLDVRHPNPKIMSQVREQIELICSDAHLKLLIHQPPIPFDPAIISTIEQIANRHGVRSRQIVSGATHDAAHIAALCPTGMIFVPCRKGISHNENEYCEPDHIIKGTQILVDTVMALSKRVTQ